MKTQVILAAALAAAFPAKAENRLTLDDFSVGGYYSHSIKFGTVSASQTGDSTHLIGGARTENLFTGCTGSPCASNRFSQYGSFAIATDKTVTPRVHALVQSTGYGQSARFEVGYGAYADMPPIYLSLAPYDRIRVNFLSLTQTLNVTMQLFTGTATALNGCFFMPSGGPFSVEFVLNGFEQFSGFDFANVNTMVLIFRAPGSYPGYAITTVEASDSHQDGAIECDLAHSDSVAR